MKKLTRKEIAAQLTLYPQLDLHVTKVSRALASGTVVPAPDTYATDKEIIHTLHQHLTMLYRLLNKYHGRYLPRRDAVLNAAINSAHIVLNDTKPFLRSIGK